MDFQVYRVWKHFHLLRRFSAAGGASNLSLFLPLHSSVLEPDFDLSFREAQHIRDLNSPASCEIAIKVKLLFQLQGLEARVRLPASSANWKRS